MLITKNLCDCCHVCPHLLFGPVVVYDLHLGIVVQCIPSLHGPYLLSAAAEKETRAQPLLKTHEPSLDLSELELEVPALDEIMNYSYAHVSTLST